MFKFADSSLNRSDKKSPDKQYSGSWQGALVSPKVVAEMVAEEEVTTNERYRFCLLINSFEHFDYIDKANSHW